MRNLHISVSTIAMDNEYTTIKDRNKYSPTHPSPDVNMGTQERRLQAPLRA